MKKILLSTLAVSLFFSASAADEVNVYSYRQAFLIEPILAAFTKETGIKTNIIFDKKALLDRIKSEGENSPADVILTVDIGRLTDAKEMGLTQAINSDVVAANIPAEFIDADKQWVGLTNRARVVAVSDEAKAKLPAIKTYADLAKPEYKGTICIRSGKNLYNVSLIASMIKHHGEEKAKAWLEGLKSNLARKPQGNDRAQVKAISEGVCDIAVLNSYYVGKMLNDDKQKAWMDGVTILFPNADDRGTHVNISGVALAKNAPNKANAQKLIEFLTGDTAQNMYAEVNYEYPVKVDVKPSKLVASWGELNKDKTSLNDIAKLRVRALEMVDEVGFDN